MAWQYAIIEHDEAETAYLALHEFYPDLNGRPSWFVEPVTFVGQERLNMIESLEAALEDVRSRPVLRMSELRAGTRR